MMCCGKVDFCSYGYFHKTNLIRGQVGKGVTNMAQLEETLDNQTVCKDRSTGREQYDLPIF